MAPAAALQPAETLADGTKRRIAEGKAAAKAPVTPEDATVGPAAENPTATTADEVTKSLAGARFAGESAVFARGTLEERSRSCARP